MLSLPLPRCVDAMCSVACGRARNSVVPLGLCWGPWQELCASQQSTGLGSRHPWQNFSGALDSLMVARGHLWTAP